MITEISVIDAMNELDTYIEQTMQIPFRLRNNDALDEALTRRLKMNRSLAEQLGDRWHNLLMKEIDGLNDGTTITKHEGDLPNELKERSEVFVLARKMTSVDLGELIVHMFIRATFTPDQNRLDWVEEGAKTYRVGKGSRK